MDTEDRINRLRERIEAELGVTQTGRIVIGAVNFIDSVSVVLAAGSCRRPCEAAADEAHG